MQSQISEPKNSNIMTQDAAVKWRITNAEEDMGLSVWVMVIDCED
jgi:hypothetical protein